MGRTDIEILVGKANFCSSYQNCCRDSCLQGIHQLVGAVFVVVLVSRTVSMFYPRYFSSKMGMLQDSKGRN